MMLRLSASRDQGPHPIRTPPPHSKTAPGTSDLPGAEHAAGNLASQRSFTQRIRAQLKPQPDAGTVRDEAAADELAAALQHMHPLQIQSELSNRFGADLGEVRVHAGPRASQLANAFGANALTVGKDIYFNENRFAPDKPEGRRLIAHELTHAAQQAGGGVGRPQFDLMQSMPTALGGFEIEMQTRGAPLKPGMEGHIRFLPDPTGPYSAQIGLIQVARTLDLGGTSTAAGQPYNYTGAEAGRMEMMTTGLHGAPPGFFVDTLSLSHNREASYGPNYLEPTGEIAGHNEYGWLRSPADVKHAMIYDYPGFAGGDLQYDFETAAKATDTQTVYGSLNWGFQIRGGAVRNEYARASSAESLTFNEALERFRGYYTHEPIVLYFDTDIDRPQPGEDSKIAGVLDHLRRYLDVRLEIDGFADERGSHGHNVDLSQRRAENVRARAVALGVDPARIDYTVGWGETSSFATGHNAGTLRANRRVVITFVRTASTPIVMP